MMNNNIVVCFFRIEMHIVFGWGSVCLKPQTGNTVVHSNHKVLVHIYLENHSVCSLVKIRTPPPPLPQASVPPRNRGGGGGGYTLTSERGGGGVPIWTTGRKGLALYLLCDSTSQLWALISCISLKFSDPACVCLNVTANCQLTWR